MHLSEPQSAQIRKSSIDHEFLQDSPELCTGVRTATLHLHQRRGRRDADRPSDRHAHRRERRRTGAARPLDAGDRRIGLPAAHGRPPSRSRRERPASTHRRHARWRSPSPSAATRRPDRIFLPATRETRSGEPLTSLPEVRLIGAEETDEVSVHCRTQCSALLTATCNGIPTQHTYGVAAEGVALFRLAAAEFPDAEAFDLHLTADGVESHFRYEVAETPQGARRLAWLNEAGGIDRYTFPLTEERRYEIERRRLLLEESGYTQTEAVGEERLRIGSAYEPAAVLDALARLAAAPAVWAVTEAGWTEIDVVSDSLRIERPGTLQRLSLEIRPRQRGGRL